MYVTPERRQLRSPDREVSAERALAKVVTGVEDWCAKEENEGTLDARNDFR
jgi:hypothetical protein